MTVPSTRALDSFLFRRLTGREKPSLSHPTSNKFEIAQWRAIFSSLSSTTSSRDKTLATVAVLINKQVRVLRDHTIAPLFAGLSAENVVMCAIANANRGFAVIRDKAIAAQQAVGSQNVNSISTLSHVLIEPYEGASKTTPDDLHNSVVDTLPHWFAIAAESREAEVSSDKKLVNCTTRGGAFLSLEHVFRSVWQEVLWARWDISADKAGLRLDPVDRDWQANWQIWDLRQQSLLLQHSVLNRHLEQASSAHPPPVLHRTVVNYDLATGVVTYGKPEQQQIVSHRSFLDALANTYLSLFYNQEVATAPGLTIDILSRSVMVLQDLAMKAFPIDYDAVSHPDRDWFRRLSYAMPRTRVVDMLTSTIGLTTQLAETCINFLSVDPKADLSSLFVTGLWHRPLIAAKGGEEILIAVGPLLWGSPIRRIERWLQVGRDSDLSKTPNGLRHEANLRAQVGEAIQNNEVFDHSRVRISSLPRGSAKEEVDMIIRIGSTLLICEVKCLLGPSEPIERNDYLRKLELASDQACRKAQWITNETDLIKKCVGDLDDGSFRVVPLVVVNQSNGVGMVVNGCHVTDSHFLTLFLSEGSYHSGAAFNAESPGSTSFLVQEIYSSVTEAEAAIPKTFETHPGLQAYRDAVMWHDNEIPLSDGSSLSMKFANVDYVRYAQALGKRFDLSK